MLDTKNIIWCGQFLISYTIDPAERTELKNWYEKMGLLYLMDTAK